jgi:MoxR-like ATPase
LILSGLAGVGKTALVKDFVESLRPDIPLFIFKATEFDVKYQ